MEVKAFHLDEEDLDAKFPHSLELTWSGVSVTSMDGTKKFLEGMSGTIRGGLTACMGGSGAGKTTLLSHLSCRLSQAKPGEGTSLLGGNPYGIRHLKAVSGFVMQEDVVFGQLTVRECLTFCARLRAPPSWTKKETMDRVEEMIVKLGLEDCLDNVIGTPSEKGISGGERKRMCIAMEMLTRPRMLFLDEPTSGLDSANSYALVKLLRELAHSEGTTILCTIHQPSTRVFNLFDNLIVLSRGQLLYHGPMCEVMAVYAEAGFELPEHHNPADHLLDVITPITPEEVEEAKRCADAIKEVATKRHFDGSRDYVKDPPRVEPIPEFKERISWFAQFRILFMRCLLLPVRAWKTMILQVCQAVFIGLMVGAAFRNINNGQDQRVRNALIFFCIVNQGIFGALHVITSFPIERAVIIRERQSGTFQVSAYFLAKVISESLLQLVVPTLYTISVYFLGGLDREPGKFFVFLLFLNLEALAATSMGIFVSAICGQIQWSLSILPLALEMSRLFGGFFLPTAQVPAYLRWLGYISYVRYTYEGVAQNEFNGLILTCTDAQRNATTGACPVPTGDDWIKARDINNLSIVENGVLLCLLIIVFRAIAYLFIRYRK